MQPKQVPDNKTGVPLAHYKQQYAAADPLEMSGRTGIYWNADRGVFSFTLLGKEAECTWPELSLRLTASGQELKPAAAILIARYLTEGRAAVGTGAFLDYAELPWGQVYNRNFDGRCRKRLAGTFGDRLTVFAEACESAGGHPIKVGDCAYELQFLPGLWLRFIIWERDEEFPPSAQILFSDNFPHAFTAEDDCVVVETALSLLMMK